MMLYWMKNQLTLELDWYSDGNAQGDYKVFVHLYDDVDSPPVAQTDMYPGNGILPPGNWLPGTISDTIMVDLIDIPAGTYRLAIGFYNPSTFDRLLPDTARSDLLVDEVGLRLFVGEVEIESR